MSIVAYGPYNFSISAKKQRYVVNEGRAQVFCAASFLSHYGDRIDVLRDVGPRKTFLIRISAASTVCRRNIPRIWRTPRCSSSKNNRLSTAEPVGPRVCESWWCCASVCCTFIEAIGGSIFSYISVIRIWSENL